MVPGLKNSSQNILLNLINSERTSRNLTPLTLSSSLSKVAQDHSLDMSRNKYFSHQSPLGSTPFTRLAQNGIPYSSAGENIAYAPTISEIHQNLMKSQEHRQNILNPGYSKIGIGIVEVNPQKIIVTEMFIN